MNEINGFFIVSSVRPLDRNGGSHCYIGQLFRKRDDFLGTNTSNDVVHFSAGVALAQSWKLEAQRKRPHPLIFELPASTTGAMLKISSRKADIPLNPDKPEPNSKSEARNSKQIHMFKRINRVLGRKQGHETETVVLVGRPLGRDRGVFGRRHPFLFFRDASDDGHDGPVHGPARAEDPRPRGGKSPCRQNRACRIPSQGRLTALTNF
jgi:hypothetical protein